MQHTQADDNAGPMHLSAATPSNFSAIQVSKCTKIASSSESATVVIVFIYVQYEKQFDILFITAAAIFCSSFESSERRCNKAMFWETFSSWTAYDQRCRVSHGRLRSNRDTLGSGFCQVFSACAIRLIFQICRERSPFCVIYRASGRWFRRGLFCSCNGGGVDKK